MRNDDTGEIVATTTIVGVQLDNQARRACEFPSAVVEAAKALLPAAH
jgi:acyl-CoA thioesterase FadM